MSTICTSTGKATNTNTPIIEKDIRFGMSFFYD